MALSVRTDLAVEARDIIRESSENKEMEGVDFSEEDIEGFKLTRVKIMDSRASEELCKPIGNYITFDLESLIHRRENAFETAANTLSGVIKNMLALSPEASVLVAGLGNRAITPDAIGPAAVDSIMATRHLKELYANDFRAFRSVSAIKVGVLGTTGVESARMISAVCSAVRPELIIAVDALASCNLEKLCRTVQITDTGITPGSGVGNSRAPLNKNELGIPVIAIGVPTVVDASTFMGKGTVSDSMIVTPRNIDTCIKDVSKLIGYSVNMALHDGLTIEDVDMFIS